MTAQEFCDKLVANNPHFTCVSTEIGTEMTESDAVGIFEALQQNNVVKTLHVEYMDQKAKQPDLTERICLALTNALAKHPSITSVHFLSCTITNFLLIARAIVQNDTLTSLSLVDISLTPNTMKGLRLLLGSNAIEELYLARCFVGTQWPH